MLDSRGSANFCRFTERVEFWRMKMCSYGEFLLLAKEAHSVDMFRLWIIANTLPLGLQAKLVQKMRAEQHAHG